MMRIRELHPAGFPFERALGLALPPVHVLELTVHVLGPYSSRIHVLELSAWNSSGSVGLTLPLPGLTNSEGDSSGPPEAIHHRMWPETPGSCR